MRLLKRINIGWVILLLLSVAAFAVSCAGKRPAPGEQPTPLVEINRIEPSEKDGRAELVIEGTGPILQYTSFQLTEPLRLVVDITDANVEQWQDRIMVNKGPVVDVTPSQRDNIARLEIGLSQTVDTRVYQDAGKLMVEFGRAEKVAKPLPPPVVEERIPGMATLVSGIKATAGRKGAKVIISGDGTMKPITFMLEGKRQRLVVDIPGTKHRVRPRVIPVRKGGLDRVRVGQHFQPEKKVRVVMDLTRQMEYTATSEGNKIIIAMTPVAAPVVEKRPPKETAPPTVAVPVPTEEKAVPTPAPVPALAERREEETIGGAKYTGRKISLDLQDADLVNVIRLFAEVANLNMILAPGVRGRVTVRMVNVPWDQAMDIILKMNGLGYVREDNILRIASLSALATEAEQLRKTKEAKKKAEDLITRIIAINYAAADEISGTIRKSLSARGETVVDKRTNTLIVKDIAQNVDEVVTLIKLLDKPIPQVMIESRIVQASQNFSRSIGVQWGGTLSAGAATGNPTGLTFPNSVTVTGGPTMGETPSESGNYFVNIPAPAGVATGGGAVGINFGSLTGALNLDLILSAIEATGEGKIISTPRVSALDNKEAKIEQGLSIPYSTTSASGTQTEFIDAKLELTVTPHVTPDNKIFMKIKVTKNAPDSSLLGAGGQPSIRKNEATTEILLSDGETAVIGGILETDIGETIDKVPFFADLPLIGWLFRKTTKRSEKRELLLFITPRVVRQEAI